MLAPKLEAMAKDNDKVSFIKIDVDECEVCPVPLSFSPLCFTFFSYVTFKISGCHRGTQSYCDAYFGRI